MSVFGDVHAYVHEYGYAAVAAGLALEHLGLPVPGETLLIAGGVEASEGALDLGTLLASAWLAAILGNMAGYAIGRYGGHRVLARYGPRIGVTAERLKTVEDFFDRYGDAIVVAARFIMPLRQLSGIVAGALEMRWLRFLLLNAAGAALWVGWWGLLSYWLGRRVLAFVRHVGSVEPLLLGLSAILLVLVAARIRRRRLQRLGRKASV